MRRFLCAIHLCVSLVIIGDVESATKLVSSDNVDNRWSTDMERGVGDQICAQTPSTVYYCAGGVCCTPGSPQSLCCPDDHPVCMDHGYQGCCTRQYSDHVCGRFCCSRSEPCCRDGSHCCEGNTECCGTEQCCKSNEPCCKKTQSDSTCCNKDKKVCCGKGFGCLDPCEYQFDALGCNAAYLWNVAIPGLVEMDVADKSKGPGIPCPDWDKKTVYRIIRPDESCVNGLLAKLPGDTKSVEEHVGCGSRQGFVSQFISTTTVYKIAEYYYHATHKGKGIVAIDLEPLKHCKFLDLSNQAIRENNLVNPLSRGYAKASCEVLLYCGDTPVPCKNIAMTSRKGDQKELL